MQAPQNLHPLLTFAPPGDILLGLELSYAWWTPLYLHELAVGYRRRRVRSIFSQ